MVLTVLVVFHAPRTLISGSRQWLIPDLRQGACFIRRRQRWQIGLALPSFSLMFLLPSNTSIHLGPFHSHGSLNLLKAIPASGQEPVSFWVLRGLNTGSYMAE
jgi:hypothetical protein